jgi:hypothetical protein
MGRSNGARLLGLLRKQPGEIARQLLRARGRFRAVERSRRTAPHAALGRKDRRRVDCRVLVVRRRRAHPRGGRALHPIRQFLVSAGGGRRALELGLHRRVGQKHGCRIAPRLVLDRAREPRIPGGGRSRRIGRPLRVDELVILQRRSGRRQRSLRLAIQRLFVGGNRDRADDLGLGGPRPAASFLGGFLLAAQISHDGSKNEGLSLGWATESTARLSTGSKVAQIHCLELTLCAR